MPTLDHLKARAGQIIRSSAWNELVDNVQKAIEGEIPYIYSHTGYFSENVFVAGRPVIKDGDPVYIRSTLTLLGCAVNYEAPELVDIFSPDLIALFDGKVRTKINLGMDAYVYLKWNPKDVGVDILSTLNAKTAIPSNAWHEFDFTLKAEDKVNVRVSPSGKVTVFVYNIPEA